VAHLRIDLPKLRLPSPLGAGRFVCVHSPPLLADRPEALQLVLAVVIPALFGVVCGVLLGVSAGAYTALSLLALLGGLAAGFEHADALEGAGRGLAGGLLFGSFILFAHSISKLNAKTSLPTPHIVLPVATTIIAILLGALGGGLRGRRERRRSREAAPGA